MQVTNNRNHCIIMNFNIFVLKITTDFFAVADVLSIEACNAVSIIHKLSHQHLYIKFWKVNLGTALEQGVSVSQLKTFPFPIVIHNFIEKQ